MSWPGAGSARFSSASGGSHPSPSTVLLVNVLYVGFFLTEYSCSAEEKGSELTFFSPSSMNVPSKADRRDIPGPRPGTGAAGPGHGSRRPQRGSRRPQRGISEL
jgi:hypothetical protein